MKMEIAMSLKFKRIEPQDIVKLIPFVGLRPNSTCDSVLLNYLIWAKYYQIQFAVSGDKAVQWLQILDGKHYAAMPFCREEELDFYFSQLVKYFNEELNEPLRIYLADEEAVSYLDLEGRKNQFRITEQTDLRDYLYDGNALRSLSGKKLHKKKNNLNYFKREYEGRYEYRRLLCSDKPDVWKFLDRWREAKGENVEEHLDYEVEGIHMILNNCALLPVRMGGVYIDGMLEAFSIGSYNPHEDMAVIHIEKADPEIRGLYQFINQQFLMSEFPDTTLVNREDDLGIEGLRKAKMSYNPVGFARKYMVEQIDFVEK